MALSPELPTLSPGDLVTSSVTGRTGLVTGAIGDRLHVYWGPPSSVTRHPRLALRLRKKAALPAEAAAELQRAEGQ